ncbi:MAG: hypothetical protein ACREQA_19900, partial [Candidatus Binatia bacterium]
MKAILKNDTGISLVVVLMSMTILLSLTAAGLLFSGINLKTASALKTGSTALQVADAGIQHALAIIPQGGNFSYSTDVTDPSPVVSTTTLGTGYTYAVTAINDAASTGGNSRAILTSRAGGPNGTKKIVTAYIARSVNYSFGAISLPGSLAAATETSFGGNSFSINGNDACSTPKPAVPGIAVTDTALKTEITDSDSTNGGLSSVQMDNVTGSGGTPSVGMMPPFEQSVTDIANLFLNLTHTDLPGGNYSSNDDWGTSGSPRITQINGDAKIQGNITGYGVLIVDGALDIQGNLEFHGLVIARGNVSVAVQGSAVIQGSVWLSASTTSDADLELDIRGNANIQYNSCDLNWVNSQVALPKEVTLTA